jgi:DNA-directed RNA polymerase beta subunit
LYEILAGRAACVSGNLIDGTAFTKNPLNVTETLTAHGFQKSGCDRMRNPQTGEQLLTEVFIGCAYYMRLCWLIKDRLHSRAKGAYQMLTLQPSEGRSREGGLKIGEMQRDAICAHGASFTIQERMSSDTTTVQVNLDTHQMVGSSLINNYDALYKSRNIVNVRMPYALKLISNELRALHMKLEFYPKNE